MRAVQDIIIKSVKDLKALREDIGVSKKYMSKELKIGSASYVAIEEGQVGKYVEISKNPNKELDKLEFFEDCEDILVKHMTEQAEELLRNPVEDYNPLTEELYQKCKELIVGRDKTIIRVATIYDVNELELQERLKQDNVKAKLDIYRAV